jgi:hypothetical protein
MNVEVYSYTHLELQAMLNNVKDDLIERINADHGLQVNPQEYVYVLQTKGCLGRVIDKFFGHNDPETTTRRKLLRLRLPEQGK